MHVVGVIIPRIIGWIFWLCGHAALRLTDMHDCCVDPCALRAAYHVEARQQGLPRKASLIVCPPTLVGHWPHEMAKFVGPELLSVLQARPMSPCTSSCLHTPHIAALPMCFICGQCHSYA
jgi:hypothetical protein